MQNNAINKRKDKRQMKLGHFFPQNVITANISNIQEL